MITSDILTLMRTNSSMIEVKVCNSASAMSSQCVTPIRSAPAWVAPDEVNKSSRSAVSDLWYSLWRTSYVGRSSEG